MEKDGPIAVGTIHLGSSEDAMALIEPGSVALSFWSPPYFVGKQYEKDATYESWQNTLRTVIHHHVQCLRPGGFMVINIADILCFKDSSIPRFQAANLSRQIKSGITREMVLAAKKKHPTYKRDQLAALMGCSEQTIDRRLNGNNIRGGKYEIQTRVKLSGASLEEFGLECGLYLYDHRIWVKDPAWANCRWTSNTLKAVSEYEDLFVFWKPGEYSVDHNKLTKFEWSEWGFRGVWRIDSVRRNDEHEAMFPLELAKRVVRLYSNPGDVVLDPFLGSGTTAVAAVQTGRQFIGIEKDAMYAKLAKKRVAEAAAQLPLFDAS